MACFIRQARTHINPSLLQIIVQPQCSAGILEDVHDIHKRKQLREHGDRWAARCSRDILGKFTIFKLIHGTYFSGDTRGPGFHPGSKRKDTKRA